MMDYDIYICIYIYSYKIFCNLNANFAACARVFRFSFIIPSELNGRFDELSASEISMIQQCEDEFRRQEATQFERIFPDEELGEAFSGGNSQTSTRPQFHTPSVQLAFAIYDNYGVATISRLLKILGLCCKRAL